MPRWGNLSIAGAFVKKEYYTEAAVVWSVSFLFHSLRFPIINGTFDSLLQISYQVQHGRLSTHLDSIMLENPNSSLMSQALVAILVNRGVIINDLRVDAEARAYTRRSYRRTAPTNTSRIAATVVKSKEVKASFSWPLKTSRLVVRSEMKVFTSVGTPGIVAGGVV